MGVHERIVAKLKSMDHWGVVVVGDATQLRSLETAKGAQIQLRIIDGAKAQDHDSFMKALWKSLELPYYFGENWSAVDDCMHDMEWMQADGYIIMATRADLLLRDSQGDFEVLLDVMKNAHADWSDSQSDGFIHGWTDLPKDMFFLFQVTPDKQKTISARLQRAGENLPIIELQYLLQ